MTLRMWGQDRPVVAVRRCPAETNRISGTSRYLLDEVGSETRALIDGIWNKLRDRADEDPELRELVWHRNCRVPRWEAMAEEKVQELIRRHEEELHERTVRQRRAPGWRVPNDRRNTWPIYPREAITVDTDWGPVTVGRHLARIYDLDGWPDAVTLEAMAAAQAARMGGTK